MNWWGLPAKIWMILFVLMPFLWLVLLSLQPTATAPLQTLDLHQFQKALSQPYLSIIIDSVIISFCAATTVLLISIPITWSISRSSAKSKNLWLALFTLPLGLNFVVRIYAWFVLFRPEGVLTRALESIGFDFPMVSSQLGVFISLIYGYLPVMFLPLYSVFEKVSRSHLEAARDLGANTIQQWWHVVIAQTRLGLLACFLFVFVPMLGEYLIPKMIGGGLVATLGTQIEGQFLGSGRPNWPFGAALSLCLLAAAVVVLALSFFLLSRQKTEKSRSWSIAHLN